MSWERSRARSVVLAALAGVALLATGCSLILDFAPASDGGPADDGAGDGGAATACTIGEPNDSADEAVPLDADGVEASVCGDSADFWSFEVDGTEDVVAALSGFSAGIGNDLEMQLVTSPGGEVLTISTGTDASERIEHSTALGNRLAEGTYAIVVLGREADAENDYRLTLTRDTAADAGP